jgi:hypothetical protein
VKQRLVLIRGPLSPLGIFFNNPPFKSLRCKFRCLSISSFWWT